jgi:Carboxypeptidase regulatory-like domain
MRTFIVSTCLLLITTFVVAASPQGHLKGTIKDSEGAVIAKAFVLVHPDTSVGRKEDIVLQTDSLGEYSTVLPAGFYDVFVSAGGFSPSSRKVRIHEGKDTVNDTILAVDPLELRERGYILPMTGLSSRH